MSNMMPGPDANSPVVEIIDIIDPAHGTNFEIIEVGTMDAMGSEHIQMIEVVADPMDVDAGHDATGLDDGHAGTGMDATHADGIGSADGLSGSTADGTGTYDATGSLSDGTGADLTGTHTDGSDATSYDAT